MFPAAVHLVVAVERLLDDPVDRRATRSCGALRRRQRRARTRSGSAIRVRLRSRSSRRSVLRSILAWRRSRTSSRRSESTFSIEPMTGLL